MIKKITLSGLKNQDTSYELGPVTVVYGENSTGKSAIRDAIYLGLLGEHPDLGKQNRALAEIKTGDLKVSLETEHGPALFTLTEKSGKVSKTHETDVPASIGHQIREAIATDFFGISDAKRKEKLLDLVGYDGVPEKLLKDIDKAVKTAGLRVPPNAPIDVKLQSLKDALKNSETEASGAKKFLDSVGLPEKTEKELLKVIEKLEEKVSKLSADIKETEETRAELSVVESQLKTDLARLSDLGDNKDSTDQDIGEIKQDIEDCKVKLDKCREAEQAIGEKLRAFATYQKGLEEVLDLVKGGHCPTCGSKVDITDATATYEKIAGKNPLDGKSVEKLQSEIDASQVIRDKESAKVSTLQVVLRKREKFEEYCEVRKRITGSIAGITEEWGTAEEIRKLSSDSESKVQGLRTEAQALATAKVEAVRDLKIYEDLKKKEAWLKESKEQASALRSSISGFDADIRNQAEGAIEEALECANEILTPFGWKISLSGDQFGVVIGDREIQSFRSLSGSEFAIVSLAVKVALSRSAPLIILDELQTLTSKRLKLFLETIVKLSEAGKLGQFIGLGTVDPIVAGVTTINVK